LPKNGALLENPGRNRRNPLVQAKPPDKAPRRIAVILGPGGSSRNLLDLVSPLLGNDRAMEMQGVFIEEAELRHAAALPFVKELCRVTFSVREFNSDQFERVLALRMRTAQRALELLARRAGVAHTFRNVRGSAASLLIEIARESDITIFEPAGTLASMAPVSRASVQGQQIVVHVGEVDSASDLLMTAAQLAHGDMNRLTVLITQPATGDRTELKRVMHSALPSRPGCIRILTESSAEALVASTRQEGPAMLVLSAAPEFVAPEFLSDLRRHLRCPICLVR
jgi:hypothetical protein